MRTLFLYLYLFLILFLPLLPGLSLAKGPFELLEEEILQLRGKMFDASYSGKNTDMEVWESCQIAIRSLSFVKGLVSPQPECPAEALTESPSAASTESEIVIDSDFITKLRVLSENIRAIVGTIGGRKIKPTPKSLYAMVVNLEAKRKFENDTSKIYKLDFYTEDWQFVSLKYELDDQQNVYFLDHRLPFAQGGFKNVYDVWSYPSGKKVVRGKARDKNNEKMMEAFRNEMVIDALIKAKLPPEHQKRFISLLGHNPDSLYMEKYDGDLASHLMDPQGFQDPFSLLSDLSESLSVAHEFGIILSDLKFKNILVKNREAVFSDMGLTIDLEKVIATGGKIPTIGTKRYAAPEQRALWDFSHLGPDGLRKLIPKRDIFALAVNMAEFFKRELVPWVQKGYCQRLEDEDSDARSDSSSEDREARDAYEKCRLHSLIEVNKRAKKGEFADKLSQLLLRGLEIDPFKRISSKSFAKALKLYQETEKYKSSTKVWTKDDINLKLQDNQHFKDMSESQAKKELKKNPQMKYVLIPEKQKFFTRSKVNYRVKMVFQDHLGKVQSKILDVDVSNHDQVNAEAEYWASLHSE